MGATTRPTTSRRRSRRSPEPLRGDCGSEGGVEKLVAIIELKKRGDSAEDAMQQAGRRQT